MALDTRLPLVPGQMESPLLALGRGIGAGQQMAATSQAMDLRQQQAAALQASTQRQITQEDAETLRKGLLSGFTKMKTMPTQEQREAYKLQMANEIKSRYGIQIPDAEIANFKTDDASIDSEIAGLSIGGVTEREKFEEEKRQFKSTYDLKMVEQAIKSSKDKIDATKDNFEKAVKIRSELQKATKDYGPVEDAFGRIRATQKGEVTGASDIALIFNFMKMLDPGSVVREGEFATAENAGGVGEKVINTYNKLLNGERLTESQRSMFVKEASKLMDQATEIHNRRVGEFVSLGSKYGLERSDIVPGGEVATGEQKATSGSIEDLVNKYAD